MHSLICQLYGQTLHSLRGELSRHEVADRGEIPLSTWRYWEVGERLPRPSHESRIIIGLDCSPLRFELVFLAMARARLEQHKRERLQLAAQSQDQHAALAVKFEKTMALQQATLEAYESLAAKLKLMERITDAKPFVVPERSDAE